MYFVIEKSIRSTSKPFTDPTSFEPPSTSRTPNLAHNSAMESDSRQLFNALSLVIVRGRDHILSWTASFYEEKTTQLYV